MSTVNKINGALSDVENFLLRRQMEAAEEVLSGAVMVLSEEPDDDFEDLDEDEDFDEDEDLDEEDEDLDEANPFHDTNGNFTNTGKIASAGGGSKSIKGQRKSRWKGKDFGGTGQGCGRKARKRGVNHRCWDDKVLGKA